MIMVIMQCSTSKLIYSQLSSCIPNSTFYIKRNMFLFMIRVEEISNTRKTSPEELDPLIKNENYSGVLKRLYLSNSDI